MGIEEGRTGFGSLIRSIGGRGRDIPVSITGGEIAEGITQSPVKLREMDFRNNGEMQLYVSFLNDPRNRSHFANTPENIAKLKKWAGEPGNHFLVVTRMEKDNDGKEKSVVVGGLELQDASPNQQDHFISLFVVDPNKQAEGIGQQMMIQVIDWAALTKTEDDRWRNKLDLAIVMGVPNWKRMERLVQRLGLFRMVSNLRNQVDVPIKRGDEWVRELRAVRRYELDLETWRTLRGLPRPEKF